MLAGGDGSRLAVSFRGEFWCSYVGYPDLNGPQALSAQPLAMFAYPLACTSHFLTLHVTKAGYQPHFRGGSTGMGMDTYGQHQLAELQE